MIQSWQGVSFSCLDSTPKRNSAQLLFDIFGEKNFPFVFFRRFHGNIFGHPHKKRGKVDATKCWHISQINRFAMNGKLSFHALDEFSGSVERQKDLLIVDGVDCFHEKKIAGYFGPRKVFVGYFWP